MAIPSTPNRKSHLFDHMSSSRSSSTPPMHRITKSPGLLAPPFAPISRNSSPSKEDLLAISRAAAGLPPRGLTASPVPRIKDRDKTRRRISKYHSVDHAVRLLRRAQNIVVLSGAGISTSLSIPDFRSDDGFYSRLSSSIGITTPEEFFSVDFFKRESESFWENVRPLLPHHARTANGTYKRVDDQKLAEEEEASTPRYSATHAFLALLQSKNKLLTNYTQNIDGLEYAAGVKPDKTMQCHGSWDTATCMTCRKTISARKYLPIVFQAGYPRCKCSPLDLENQKISKKKKSPKKRKRLVYEGDSDHDSDDGTKTPNGLYKPDITFFGEEIPDFYVPRLESDKLKADLIIILGTSLKVRPVKMMVTDFPPGVPQIWINRDRFSGYQSDLPGVQFDIELLGECDLVIEELCRRAGLDLTPFLWESKSSTRAEPSASNTKAKPDTLEPIQTSEAKIESAAGNKRKNRHSQILSPVPQKTAQLSEDELQRIKRKRSAYPSPETEENKSSLGDTSPILQPNNSSEPPATIPSETQGNPEPPILIEPAKDKDTDTTMVQDTAQVEDPTKHVQDIVTIDTQPVEPVKEDPPPRPAESKPATRPKDYYAHVEADLDADWRWRFQKRMVRR